jgi:hypothetical protein
LGDAYPYAPKHNAYVYVNDINGRSSYCTAHTRSYSDLAGDLATNTAARCTVITSHRCDDMHDSCSATNDVIKQGDSWLQSNLPAILSSQAYKKCGAVSTCGHPSSVVTHHEEVPLCFVGLVSRACRHPCMTDCHCQDSSTPQRVHRCAPPARSPVVEKRGQTRTHQDPEHRSR